MGYPTYVLFAVLLVLAPGPDVAVVLKNSLLGGRRRGLLTAIGVASSAAVQGTAAAFGLGVVIVRSQWLFQTVRWAGVAYLAYLGFGALRSAFRGRYPAVDATGSSGRAAALRGWRQGFLSNITNPKVLVFYLSVLPQFIDPGHTSALRILALAYTHAFIGVIWLTVLVSAFHLMREWLARQRVRRAVDTLTATALLGFSARLATE